MSDYTVLLFAIIFLGVIVVLALFAMRYLWKAQQEHKRETRYDCTEKAMQTYADERLRDERRHAEKAMQTYVDERLREGDSSERQRQP